MNDAARGGASADKALHAQRRGVGESLQSDPADAQTIFLSGHADQCLALRATSRRALLQATR